MSNNFTAWILKYLKFQKLGSFTKFHGKGSKLNLLTTLLMIYFRTKETCKTISKLKKKNNNNLPDLHPWLKNTLNLWYRPFCSVFTNSFFLQKIIKLDFHKFLYYLFVTNSLFNIFFTFWDLKTMIYVKYNFSHYLFFEWYELLDIVVRWYSILLFNTFM